MLILYNPIVAVRFIVVSESKQEYVIGKGTLAKIILLVAIKELNHKKCFLLVTDLL